MYVASLQPGRCSLVVPFLAALAIGLAGESFAAVEADAKQSKEEGFTPLLEGDQSDAWVGYGKQQWPKEWELKDGILHRKGSGGDLMTTKEYGDFDLRFAWKVSRAAGPWR